MNHHKLFNDSEITFEIHNLMPNQFENIIDALKFNSSLIS